MRRDSIYNSDVLPVAFMQPFRPHGAVVHGSSGTGGKEVYGLLLSSCRIRHGVRIHPFKVAVFPQRI